MLRAANLLLLILLPVAWFAPLLRAGLLPFFDLDAISVISGLGAIWDKDVLLALVVSFFAIVAPYLKTIGLALVQFGLAPPRLLPVISFFGRLAMADIFLVAIYIVLAKGVGVGRLETGWGLYLFTFCVLASLGLSALEKRRAAY
ncbi:MAG: paraquat-inducible protein A [Proteobacteria bacterium]|nr:paraquat-inducible protein A [Pseudomonadota bacterium]